MSDYENLDGLKIEIDAELKLANIILDRPPYNVVSMLQREHLSSVFKKLNDDKNVRIIVIKGEGKNFSSGGNIQGFMEIN